MGISEALCDIVCKKGYTNRFDLIECLRSMIETAVIQLCANHVTLYILYMPPNTHANTHTTLKFYSNVSPCQSTCDSDGA